MAKRRKRIWVGGSSRHPICCPGPPDNDVCHNLSLLEAEPSEFHDEALISATREINGIFSRLRDARHPEGTDLALLNTSLGLLLAWVEGRERQPEDIASGVTYDSDEEDIRGALGLRGEATAA